MDAIRDRQREIAVYCRLMGLLTSGNEIGVFKPRVFCGCVDNFYEGFFRLSNLT